VSTLGLIIQLGLLAAFIWVVDFPSGLYRTSTLLPVLLAQGLFAVALGLPLAVLNVFFRDVAMAVPVVLQVWFWLTPIAYPLSALPESVAWWVNLNPVAVLAKAAQFALVPGVPAPEPMALGILVAVSAALLWVGVRMVRRNLALMRDEL